MALDVVLTPPQRHRLRRLLGRCGSPVEERLRVDVSGQGLAGVTLTGDGWHRYAVLAPDRVVLLPRDHRWVPGLEREAVALRLLAAHGIAAPRLLDRIEDPRLWPYPVLVISRCPASVWSDRQSAADHADWARMLCSLAELIAAYHRIPAGRVPDAIRSAPAASPDVFEGGLPRFSDHLDPVKLEETAAELARSAELDTRRGRLWVKIIEPCLRMAPTLVHGDINEGQIMVDGRGCVNGLIDWESARIGHPLSDFDFGEWGPQIWALERDFGQLRRLCWQHYTAERGGELPDWRAVHLLMTIVSAPGPEGDGADWTGTRRAHTLANLRDIDAQL